jgi:hypothetical protein
MDRRPGRAVGVGGTLAAIVGVALIVITFVGRPYGQGGLGTDGLFVGGLLLLGGLLLRIEAAVKGTVNRPM